MKESRKELGCGKGVLLDPDAVIVVTVTIITNLLYMGTAFAGSGLYLQEFLHVFNAGKSHTAWTASIQVGSPLICCVFTGPIIDCIGTRLTCALGGALSFLGFLTAAFSPNFASLMVTYGFIAGLGMGLVILPGALSVQQHTHRHRALASGLSMVGGSLGVFIMPNFIKWALKTYGWRGALLLHSSLLLHMVPCGMLLFSPRKQGNSSDEDLVASSSESIVGMCPTEKEECNYEINGGMSALERKPTVSSQVVSPHNENRGSPITNMVRDPICFFVGLAFACIMGSYGVPYVYIPLKVSSEGLPDGAGPYLISVIGIADVASRIFGSFLGSFGEKTPIFLFNASIFTMAISMGCIMVAHNIPALTVLMVLLGLGTGSMNAMIYTVLRDIVGMEMFHWVAGIGFAAAGVLSIALTQLLAYIWEVTNSLAPPFILSGIIMMSGACSTIAAKVIQIKRLHASGLPSDCNTSKVT